MESFSQRTADILDAAARALKDKADAVREAVCDAAARLFPAPIPVPVDTRRPVSTPRRHS
ncbi:MAG TPA: hypothetical protein VL128_01595 [Candidatus Eisenbacteria bacterium]|nr:hypothetical protein [Candidatus Eisenbacteria bacterium]